MLFPIISIISIIPIILIILIIMANLTTIHLAHLPSDLAVYIAFFRNLKNAAFLRQQLLDGNADFEYALVEANVVWKKVITFFYLENWFIQLLTDPLHQACSSSSFQGGE